ncbi:hypothetical protein [Terrabacter sp. BE26]|uniref:hypothetical protein n=1 Tax=Terrabacter sp. BE26 TaxID=2898152 RepID=UPI0035BE6C68
MTTNPRPDGVLAPADNDVPSRAQPTPEKKRHRVLPVVAGAAAFGAGVAIGSNLTWRFSIWWKPS